MKRIGCIADDFTGASDIASFFAKGGMRTLLFNGIPQHVAEKNAEALVISLKTRTQETSSAVSDSLAALQWLKKQECAQFYIKYCSTFDSTPRGNIGPICDAVMEELQVPFTILCPALPVNGRTVRNGRLFVKGVPLEESPMRDHPLTPMWDSRLVQLMTPQSRYPVYLEGKQPKNVPGPFYLVPDCETDEDLEKIAEKYGSLLRTGGSGLAEPLARRYAMDPAGCILQDATKGPAIILAGSCSEQTRRQIAVYQERGGPCYYLDPFRLLDGKEKSDDLVEWTLSHSDMAPLIYSSADPETVRKVQQKGKEKISGMLEEIMAEIALHCVEAGISRVIVAGGETSGALTRRLGFDCYEVGSSIAPGVPIMIPMARRNLRIVLKSGNFGDDTFFLKAVKMTGGSGIAD